MLTTLGQNNKMEVNKGNSDVRNEISLSVGLIFWQNATQQNSTSLKFKCPSDTTIYFNHMTDCVISAWFHP